MSRQLSEKRLLKILGIPDFRHMSKDKIMRFASCLDRIDPEVAKAAIAQFPEFATVAKEGLANYKEIFLKVLDDDAEDSKICYAFYDRVMQQLEDMCQDDTLTFDEKQVCIKQMFELTQLVSEKAKENKRFKAYIIALAGGTLLGILYALLSALGGHGEISLPFDDLTDSDYEI